MLVGWIASHECQPRQVALLVDEGPDSFTTEGASFCSPAMRRIITADDSSPA